MNFTITKRFCKKILPPFIFDIYRYLKHNNSKSQFNQKEVSEVKIAYKYYCPVCRTHIIDFNRLPDFYMEQLDINRNIHPFFYSETMNYLKYLCPNCSTSDRNRLYALYFEQFFRGIKDINIELKFLDIAPDKTLAKFIKSFNFINYRSVDLLMEDVDDRSDITNLSIYEDNRFDVLLCSHVLEHIVEDRKAMLELYRILKPGGFGIIMVPILLTLSEDLENPEWTSEADRWKYYGQNDHVRMYSKPGFIEKLTNTGFKVNQYGINYFGKDVFEKSGIHARSVLHVVEK
jgi:SAM-dependent methyltransferase